MMMTVVMPAGLADHGCMNGYAAPVTVMNKHYDAVAIMQWALWIKQHQVYTAWFKGNASTGWQLQLFDRQHTAYS